MKLLRLLLQIYIENEQKIFKGKKEGTEEEKLGKTAGEK